MDSFEFKISKIALGQPVELKLTLFHSLILCSYDITLQFKHVKEKEMMANPLNHQKSVAIAYTFREHCLLT